MVTLIGALITEVLIGTAIRAFTVAGIILTTVTDTVITTDITPAVVIIQTGIMPREVLRTATA